MSERSGTSGTSGTERNERNELNLDRSRQICGTVKSSGLRVRGMNQRDESDERDERDEKG